MLDTEEMERLFRSHYGEMYRLARCILHDDEESKDVVSDVFTRIAAGATVPGSDKIRHYLLVSVRNTAYDVVRRRQTRQRVSRLYPLETTADISPVSDDAELSEAVIRFAETRLTEQTARVFRLRFDGGRRYAEIADELNISVTAVYKHLSQALRKMKEHFNPNGNGR